MEINFIKNFKLFLKRKREERVSKVRDEVLIDEISNLFQTLFSRMDYKQDSVDRAYLGALSSAVSRYTGSTIPMSSDTDTE